MAELKSLCKDATEETLSLCHPEQRACPERSEGTISSLHSYPRPLPAPAGVAAPQSRNLVGGEDCLSEASSAALTFGTEAKAPPWGHARAPMVLGPFAETKGPRRAGPKPRKNLFLARKLRKEQTNAEQLLWSLLRNRQFCGLKFRRQYPLAPYVLDFYCDEERLGIELEGGQHNESQNIHLEG